jgi:hypothetical protein
MVWCLIKHGDNFVIKHPNRILQIMFLYLQLAVLDTRTVLTKNGEGLLTFAARGMTGGHLAQWDRHSTEAPIHQLLFTEPGIMGGTESKGIGGIFRPEIWKTQRVPK